LYFLLIYAFFKDKNNLFAGKIEIIIDDNKQLVLKVISYKLAPAGLNINFIHQAQKGKYFSLLA